MTKRLVLLLAAAGLAILMLSGVAAAATTKTLQWQTSADYTQGYKHSVTFTKYKATVVGRDFANVTFATPYAVCLETRWIAILKQKTLSSVPVFWNVLTDNTAPYYDLVAQTPYGSQIKGQYCRFNRNVNIWAGQQAPTAPPAGLEHQAITAAGVKPMRSITHYSYLKIYMNSTSWNSGQPTYRVKSAVKTVAGS